MTAEQNNPKDRGSHGLSRRSFLKATAISAGAATLSLPAWEQALAQPPEPAAAQHPKVVRIKADRILDPRGIHEEVLTDILQSALKRLTGLPSPIDAWHTILASDDRIALKFNRSAADGLGTTDAMLHVLVRSLGEAGFAPEKLMTVEVTDANRKDTHTIAPVSGWSEEAVVFQSGKDQLALWLEDVTAIINVPFLKHHNIAGITCCLKNLSHAVVKHPAHYHDNGCSPYIGDIVALPQIRSKLKLNLVNALRVVFDGGPEAQENLVWDAGMLLAGFDPVAVDVVALQILDTARARLGLPKIAATGPPAYLEAAAARGLGVGKLHHIELERVKL